MDELGAFLKSRRGRISPSDVGLVRYGERRRVPGLRREELAQLAGVSVSYYARLEQGLGQNVSDAILDALARALRLDAAERAHLAVLARPRRAAAGAARREDGPLPEGLERLLAMMAGVPVMVLSPTSDVLAWNDLAHALFAGHRTELPNMTRMVFLDPRTRELFVNWPEKSRSVVAHLRMVAARLPGDRRVRALVNELLRASPEFASLWQDHSVATCDSFTNVLRHPLAGELTVHQEVLRGDDPELMVVAFTVEPGSPSEAALRRLAAAGTPLDRRVPVA
ncbi:helix-turn-helix transcriptional regulator [Kitasatospora sp. NPDC088351]|uniref:helix-turn-helix transcriptional regulator n=1 Tax=unclassified Kitasatospora TaxID=2633591 RepID=UPI0034359D7E